MKKACGLRGNHQKADGAGAGGLAEQGNIVFIPAKDSNIFLHPLQGRNLIQKTVVAGDVQE